MLKEEFSPTEEQLAIREATRRSQDSLMIKAYAGCAKTTTLELLAPELRVAGLALAFNKSIATELERRFPSNLSVKTMNALGFGALRRGLPQVANWKVEPKKLGKIVTEISKQWKLELKGEDWANARDLAGAAMTAGLVPNDEGRPLQSDSPAVWQSLWEGLGLVDGFDESYEVAQEALRRNNELTLQGIISFDDQIYASTCLWGRFPQFPLLLVDEAQDLSPMNHEMLRLASRPDARLVAVGDPKQAIYAFRGASTESMGKIEALRGLWRQLPLTLTFRCPKVVVARQQRHAPGFRAAEGNAEGEHKRLMAGWSGAELLQLAGPKDLAVLCRNNAPLLSLAFKMIAEGIGVEMLGRDIGKGLVELSKKLAKEDSVPKAQFAARLREWEESETSLALANAQEEKLESILDKAACLRAVLEDGEVRDAGELRRALQRLFEPSAEGARVVLSTVHKAKGLEWDVVVHLDPWRVPSKRARQAAAEGRRGQLEQEMNLKYVCETRSKWGLWEANLKEYAGGASQAEEPPAEGSEAEGLEGE